MVIDPYHSKDRYLAWKRATEQGIPGVSAENSQVIREYVVDMETGRNVARGSKRGGRGYLRLIALGDKMTRLARLLEAREPGIALRDASEQQVLRLFMGMRNGDIRKRNGGVYRATRDYVKVFRAFWHWHMKVQKKRGILIQDICEVLDDSTEKPPWVYLTFEDVQRLCRHAKHRYRVLMLFLYDAGIRSPTELVNVRVADLREDCTKLHISEQTSKTFGRTINLLLCAAVLRDYIREQGLSESSQVFPICPAVVNRYLRRLAKRVLGDRKSLAGSRYSDLTMYDFRHSSACYWLPRYKAESALKYRLGWKRSEMIQYYTEFLGMKDTITHEDLCTGPERTALEQRLAKTEQEKQLLQEQLQALQQQMNEVLGVVNGLVRKAGETSPGSPGTIE